MLIFLFFLFLGTPGSFDFLEYDAEDKQKVRTFLFL
jgi:hypothetical protein